MEGFTKYLEGETVLLVPKVSLKVPQPPKVPAFFNPRGKEVRDLVVLAYSAFSRICGEIRVADPLAGVGAKSLRIAKETNVKKVYVNDLNPTAIKACLKAAEINGVTSKVEVYNKEANLFMLEFSSPEKRFNGIDVDPFGSPIPFIDSAFKAIRNGGMLTITATDTTILNGLYPRVARRRYIGVPARDDNSKESGLRLLISSIVWRAAALDLAAHPLFGYSTHHYVCCFLKIERSASKADALMNQIGYVYYCTKCGFKGLKNDICPICCSKLSVAGPLWLSSIHNKDFLKQMLEEVRKRMFRKYETLILRALNEIDLPPFYYSISWICDNLQLRMPSMNNLVNEIKGRGYRACRSSIDNVGIKTDAPYNVLLEILKELSLKSEANNV